MWVGQMDKQIEVYRTTQRTISTWTPQERGSPRHRNPGASRDRHDGQFEAGHSRATQRQICEILTYATPLRRPEQPTHQLIKLTAALYRAHAELGTQACGLHTRRQCGPRCCPVGLFGGPLYGKDWTVSCWGAWGAGTAGGLSGDLRHIPLNLKSRKHSDDLLSQAGNLL